MTTIATRELFSSPYQGYAYSYPHKTAYRPLEQPIPLASLWEREDRSALFLYVHIPFCEIRCSFCNLFTQAKPKENRVSRYFDALNRQIEAIQPIMAQSKVVRCAIGGGTPTFLSQVELEALFGLLRKNLAIELQQIPVSVEASPATVDPEKLAFLRENGITRLSMGVQSFLEEETKGVARPQKPEILNRALKELTDCGIPTINLDLIYGLPGQTLKTWSYSLERALENDPEEIYLYPLYVRDLTALGRSGKQWDDQRIALYRFGRDRLLQSGYRQCSMRMFQKGSGETGPVYCCQNDGMLGLGCGARSYTRALHYSNEFAVGAAGVREILETYTAQSKKDFMQATYGFHLDQDEEHRRFVIQSLLQANGLSLEMYRDRFDSCPLDDLPQLRDLEPAGMATQSETQLKLTPKGLEWSDAIGPWVYSTCAQQLMETYDLR